MITKAIAQTIKKPGFVDFKILNNLPQLDDLWFMVGSRCNLSCKHCYVGSSPTNDNLEQINLEDVKPFIEESLSFGVKNIYYTGGEPFINLDILDILKYSLTKANVTVLTNATFPITRFIENLKKLNNHSPNKLKFRVSLDHFNERKHDLIRGQGNFKLTVLNTNRLIKAGFKPIITATAVVYENNNFSQKEIVQKFKNIFYGKVEVKLLPFDIEMGSNLKRIKHISNKVFISEECMRLPGITQENFQCHNGRAIEKIDGRMVVYPCPIIYDDKEFEMADNLKDSFTKVHLTHKACFDFCYKSKGKCTN